MKPDAVYLVALLYLPVIPPFVSLSRDHNNDHTSSILNKMCVYIYVLYIFGGCSFRAVLQQLHVHQHLLRALPYGCRLAQVKRGGDQSFFK